MHLEAKEFRSFWLTLFVATLLFSVMAARASFLRASELGMDLTRSAWGGILLLYLATAIFCIWMLIHVARDGRAHLRALSALEAPVFDSVAWRLIGFVAFAALVFLIPWAKFSLNVGRTIENPSVDPFLVSHAYFWMCWWVILLSVAALKIVFKTSWPLAFISTLVILGIAYETWIRFGAVTTYPLSMGWSEGSRYFYASLYFSKSIYGEPFPLSTLHPSRYFLQSIPFLFPSLGLPAHRFWQFLLWIVLTAWAAVSIASRVTPQNEKVVKWLLAGGLFIFFLRVGVYYHLEPMVILPMAFVSAKHPVRSFLAVIAASLWAGVSRVNWFPMPAMIAAAIYLLETPFAANQSGSAWKQMIAYFSPPALWMIVGLACALLAQAAYIPLSGNSANVEAFASSINSDLLWYRLWPNDNHFLGVVPAMLLFGFPFMAIIVMMALQQWKSLHVTRWLGLFAMLAVLFIGSLAVSVKIGGGGDLHNMDTFAVMLGIVSAYFIGGQVAAEFGSVRPVRPWALLSLAVLIPMMFLIPALGSRDRYNEEKNEKAFQAVAQIVNEAGKSGPVLLINERQLVTFQQVHAPFVPEYEAVTLMEMAMSNNEPYLERFYSDLRNHRFSMIVANPQNTVIKEGGAGKEENNIWNTRVAPYIICYYQPTERFDTDGNRIQIYVPNPAAQNCP